VVGRHVELTAVEGFLEAARGGLRALALTGPAGIGKTTVCAREFAARASGAGSP
jgi:flagellar biosynthesis GTPase FlhF